MKKAAVLCFVLSYAFSQAQEIDVKETDESFSTGKHEALSTVIYQRNQSDVSKAWKSYLKDLKAEKVNDGKKEMFADNVIFSDLGNNPVDVYTIFKEDKSKKEVTMVSAYDLGGAYLNSKDHGDKQKAIKKLMRDFAYNQSKQGLQDVQQSEEKRLSELQGDQKGLEKDNAGLKKDIENYKSKIAKAEKDIITTETELEQKKADVAVQKKVVDASSNAVSEQAKSANKIYDKLQGQQKDLEKKRDGLKDDIKNYNNKIDNANKEITKNEDAQQKKKKEIDVQTDKISGIKKKIDDLK